MEEILKYNPNKITNVELGHQKRSHKIHRDKRHKRLKDKQRKELDYD